MAYRNGTYVAFHAEGNSDSSQSDMKYYRMLTAWHANDSFDFKINNSHDKVSAVRDTSSRETLRNSLRERLGNSCNMLLIIGDKTRNDTDWIPEEITYAIDTCKIPIIAAYPGYDTILNPVALRHLWPASLSARIDSNTASVIHIPFRQLPIDDAIKQFNHDNLPKGGGLGAYSADTYRGWGLKKD